MVDDYKGSIRNLVKWLGLEFSDDTVEFIASKTDFQAAKKMERSKELPGPNNAGKRNEKVRGNKAKVHCMWRDEVNLSVDEVNEVMYEFLPTRLMNRFLCDE